jgi:hypothetical protein
MNATKFLIVIVLGMMLLSAAPALALVEVVEGNRPMADPGLPKGAAEVGNLPTRIQCVIGPPFGTGSLYQYQYRGDTAAFNEVLKHFAAIDAPSLELVVHNGPWTTYVNEQRVDWGFDVWIPERWNELYNGPRSFVFADEGKYNRPVPPPRIDIYVGGGEVVWEQVRVPPNIMVIDKRPQSISPQFAGKGLVRIRAVSMATGEPVAATIVLTRLVPNDPNAEPIVGGVAKDGFAQIAGVEPGYYEIRVQAPCYASRRLLDRYDNRNPEYYEATVRLAPESSIAGRVVDLAGNPIGGVKVRADNAIGPDGRGYRPAGQMEAVTDSDGAFLIRQLPRGRVSLHCRSEGLHQESSIFEQYDVPSADLKIVMTGTGIIRGRVVDAKGNPPADQVHVHARPPGDLVGKWGGSMRCQPDGTFEFKNVPPGEYLLSTKLMSAPTDPIPADAQTVTVIAGKTSQVEIKHTQRRTRNANPGSQR